VASLGRKLKLHLLVYIIDKAVCVLESLVSLRENLAVHCAVLVRMKKKKKKKK
jgi:hypothetical protein